MRHRVMSLWLPGIATSVASLALLQVLNRAGVKPVTISVGEPHYLVFHSFWLLALPPLGALGAWWSERAGGGVWERVLAGISPASPVAVVCVAVFPLALVVDSNVSLRLMLSTLGVSFLNWSLIPGAALFLGVLPFLKQRPLPSVASRNIIRPRFI